MGMVTAKRIKGFKQHEISLFLFAILGAGASYIAMPATMKLAEPRTDAGIYIPMALGIFFPFNITIGMPMCYAFIQMA